jgi:hypothetical protein
LDLKLNRFNKYFRKKKKTFNSPTELPLTMRNEKKIGSQQFKKLEKDLETRENLSYEIDIHMSGIYGNRIRTDTYRI